MTLRSWLSHLFGFDPKQPRIWKLSVRQWVWIFAGFSVALQLFISILSSLEFRQGAYDLGVSMQAFSNTGNGRFFWAAGTYLHHGTVSLLNNHLSWVYFAVYPIYSAFPGQTTLFVVQAVPIALAAIPLASLATDASGSPRKGLLVAGLYLLWAPMYAGMPNSFHLEAFLPVLFFSLVLVWYRKQYVLGLVLAVVTGFTLDVAPVFTALVAIMFLTYPLQEAIRTTRRSSRQNPNGRAQRLASRVSAAGRRIARITVVFSRSRAAWAGTALVLVSILVFVSMRYIEANFVGWFGIHGSSLANIYGPSLTITRNLGSLSNVGFHVDAKVEFWLVILATVGFLPLLYPRILIILVPWIVYTFFQAAYGWYVIPSHYVAIAAVPLFLGMALGIGALPLSFRSSSAVPIRETAPGASSGQSSLPGAPLQAQPQVGSLKPSVGLRSGSRRAEAGLLNGGSASPTPSASTPTRRHRRAGQASRAKWMYVGSIVLIAGVLVANVGLNPVNPLTAGMIAATASSGNRLFTGAGNPYSLTLKPAPGFDAMVQLVGQIPPNAPLLVQGQFYPLVSNDPNAFPYNGVSPLYNPFNNTFTNTTTLPEYVLSTRGGLGLFKDYVNASRLNISGFSNVLWNDSVYGVVGWVQTTRLGSVFLFEKGYTGPTKNFGPISYPQIEFVAAPTVKESALKPGPAGKLRHSWDEWAVYSKNGSTGRVWTVFDRTQSLPAGKYTLVVEMYVGGGPGECLAVATDTTLLNISGYDVPTNSPLFPNQTISYYQGMCGHWRPISVTFVLPHPVAVIDLDAVRPPPTPVPLEIAVSMVELLPDGSLTG